MMSFSSASTSAARARTSTSRRSASPSAATRRSAVTRPWMVRSSAGQPAPGPSDAMSLLSTPWGHVTRSAPVARTTGRKPRSTSAAPSRSAAYSAAGSAPKRRGSTTPRSSLCTAPRPARCECSAVSSIALEAMRRPLRLDKRPTPGRCGARVARPAARAARDRGPGASRRPPGRHRRGRVVQQHAAHALPRARGASGRAPRRARRSPRLALSLGPRCLRAHHQLRDRRRPRRGERRARRVSAHQPLARGRAPPRRVADPRRLPRPGVAARRRGRCSFGTGAWFSPAYCRAARTVIGEVHDDFVRTGGDSWAPVERFRHLVPAEEPTGMVTTAPRTEEETAATEVICTLVAHELVHDRDTLQIGIGTVSSALGLYLDHRHDLGVQSEAITAGIPSLVQRGVVTGRQKALHPGAVVGSFMLGLTPEDLAFVDGHPGFALYSFGATDDVTLLVRERNLTAVNNALLVDLTGQVASEGIGTQLWSGVGGQAAFAIAAAYSPGGRAIFVLPSAHRMTGGLRSRIVPVLPPGTPVTLPRGFVDYVVTEHGIATLRGKTLRQRVEELVAVSHPDFRAALRAEARRLHSC